ncbi:RadC family protein [Muricoccus nepalensis]|uniref:RadC family protein n=1 Tax=Muricoccus nepalensis TaxID=1854500 RepID=UPI001F503AD7|nr:DNA repair protein RadC [Roseomonas nepalensis]
MPRRRGLEEASGGFDLLPETQGLSRPPRARRTPPAPSDAQADPCADPDANSRAETDTPAKSPAARKPAEAAPAGPEGHRARLRAKLLRAGPDALADYELLEMLLFLALPRVDTKPHARRLLARFGSFAGAVAAREADLRAVEGIGEAAVAALLLVQAAALKLLAAEVRDEPVLNNPDRLIAYLSAAMARAPVEQFRVLFLDSRNRLIADEVLAHGTVNHAPVYPREVIKRALELGATALILVHNHPSGDPTPSLADIEMTREIRAGAATLSIVVHDHLIIGNGRHVSFRREGLL